MIPPPSITGTAVFFFAPRQEQTKKKKMYYDRGAPTIVAVVFLEVSSILEA